MSKSSNEGVLQAKKSLPTWAIVLIFIAGLAIGFGIFWLIWTARTPKVVQNPNLPTPAANSNQPPSDVALPPTDTTPLTTNEEGQTTKNSYAEYILTPVDDNLALPITWTTPGRIDPAGVFGDIVEANRQANMYDTVTSDGLIGALKSAEVGYKTPVTQEALGTWKLGTVTDGKYQGYVLYEQRDGMCDMGGCTNFRFIVAPDGKRGLTLGQLNLDYMRSFRTPPQGETAKPYLEYEKILTPAFNLSLKDSNVKAVDLKANGKTVYIGGNLSWDTAYMDWLRTGGKMDGYIVLGKTANGLTIYGNKDMGCGYVQLPDKTFSLLASKIPVKNPEGYNDEDKAMDIKWDELALGGKKPANLYMATGGGCDNFCPVKAEAGEDVRPEALVKIGTVNGNEPIFMPKDPSKSATVKLAYDSWYLPDGKAKPSFEEFLKSKPIPIFLWQDAFGRWMRYADIELSPQAECGKPVIYLYPTKTTPVSVSLPRFINVTVSEPTYSSRGWQTVAQPDGTLTMADGQQFGSLYWEGTGVGYVAPREGFMVKDGQQKVFLTETLAKYGLNAKESQEFMDFWLPKMTGAPYYRVSFLTDTWSKAAPLYVNPKPDTNIRIFMDWQKLSAPINIATPKIITPARNGFTLVEWGGLLYKN